MDIQLGDEVLVKFKVEHVCENGRLFAYSTSPSGGLISRTSVHPSDVIEVIKRPISVGDKFENTDFICKVEAIVKNEKDDIQYAAVSIRGYIQIKLISVKVLEEQYKRV